MLKLITDHLQDKYQPKAILLHGSRARGDALPESDYDIAIILSESILIFPYEYNGVMLDIKAFPLNTEILETSTGVPKWPLQILYDDQDRIGERIYEETKKVYEDSPPSLSSQEWANRRNFLKRLVYKIEGHGKDDLSIRHYYLADFYTRVIRYWFEKQKKWTVSAHLALPIIKAEAPKFFVNLNKLWTEEYAKALQNIELELFVK